MSLREFESSPRYGRPVVVAEGTKARDGADAHMYVHLQGPEGTVKLKERDGRVDFKDISRVENVVVGQLLASKVPAEPGQPGQTVTGKLIPAEKGKDCDLAVGKNVKLSEDGLSALAETNGQVLLLGGKVNVEPIYTVAGNVDLRTGNVLFLGTVVVRGNVEDGFAVKAAGNIEVFGSVGKCTLDAEGDIVVHQGIAAKTEGKVRCGKSLYSKFIEHAHVDAGENVVVTDGIVHSYVDANKMILCQGKRAQIVGGRLRASEEINSKILGSVAGTETLLEVGYDPRSKERLVQLEDDAAGSGEIPGRGRAQHQDPGDAAEGAEEAAAGKGAVSHRAERKTLPAPGPAGGGDAGKSPPSTPISPPSTPSERSPPRRGCSRASSSPSRTPAWPCARSSSSSLSSSRAAR